MTAPHCTCPIDGDADTHDPGCPYFVQLATAAKNRLDEAVRKYDAALMRSPQSPDEIREAVDRCAAARRELNKIESPATAAKQSSGYIADAIELERREHESLAANGLPEADENLHVHINHRKHWLEKKAAMAANDLPTLLYFSQTPNTERMFFTEMECVSADEFRRVRAERDEARRERDAASTVLDELVAPDKTKSLAQRIQDEFADFKMVLAHCAAVYCHFSRNRISKQNTLPDEVIRLAEEFSTEDIQAATKELTDDNESLRAKLTAAQAACAEKDGALQQVSDWLGGRSDSIVQVVGKALSNTAGQIILDRLAKAEAEARDHADFMAFMTAELAAFPCCHEPGEHASTPPMMWPELIACIAKKARQDAEAKFTASAAVVTAARAFVTADGGAAKSTARMILCDAVADFDRTEGK